MDPEIHKTIKFSKAEIEKFIANGARSRKKKFRNVTVYDKSKQICRLGDKIIVPKEDIHDLVATVYKDPKSGFISAAKLYLKLRDRFAGISRRDVNAVVNKSETKQLHQEADQESKVVKPIVLSRPFAHFQVDTVDLTSLKNYNYQFRYLFTCIDLFSKFAFVKPIRKNTAKATARALSEAIGDRPKPTIVQSDNGHEFAAEFHQYLEDNKIQHVKSSPYKPSSNGAIERFHRTLKTMLNRAFTQFGTVRYLELIQDIVQNYNNTVHSATQFKPTDLHKPDLDEKIRLAAYDNLQSNATRMIEQSGATNEQGIRPGDHVRVALKTIESVAKLGKMRKKYLPQWSSEVYKVQSVSKAGIDKRKADRYDESDDAVTLEEYTLCNLDGTKKTGRQKYKSNEILKVDTKKMIKVTEHKSTKQHVADAKELPADDEAVEEAASDLQVTKKQLETVIEEHESESDSDPDALDKPPPQPRRSARLRNVPVVDYKE